MPFLKPDRYLSRLTCVDIQSELVDQGLTCVLLDIDNTIRPRDTHVIPDDIMRWMEDAKAAGVHLCLLSNNFHANAHELADELGLPIVAKAMKPLPHGYIAAMSRMGARARETVVIGDQMFTDISGAHLLGVKAFMVAPLAQKDLAHTLVLRKVQDKILGGADPEALDPAVESADPEALDPAIESAEPVGFVPQIVEKPQALQEPEELQGGEHGE